MSISQYWSILLSQPKPVRFIASRLLMHSQLSESIILRRNDYKIRFHRAALSASLWVNPAERVSEERFLEGCLSMGDTVIDVGANIGTISLACSKAVGAEGLVLAIEPHPRTYRRLVENVALNGLERLVVTTNIALGDQPGIVHLTDYSDDTQNTVTNTKNSSAIAVVAVPLDSIAPAREIALIKIDAEGYEPRIIAGAASVCARTKMLYTEFDPQLIRRQELDPGLFFEKLRCLGFDLYRFDKDGLSELGNFPDKKSMVVGLKADVIDVDKVRRAAARSQTTYQDASYSC